MRQLLSRYNEEKSKVQNSVYDIPFSCVCYIFFCVERSVSYIDSDRRKSAFGARQEVSRCAGAGDRKENFLETFSIF